MIIYKTTNVVNGKIYVGKDTTNNPKYLGSGLILKKAIKKYGVKNFKKEIIECCNSLEELNEREMFWITTLNSVNKKIGYNISNGGDGGDTFSGHDDKTKKKLQIKYSIIQKKNWKSKSYRKKHHDSLKRMWKNPSHKKHMSKMMTGREIKWKKKISNSIKKWHKTNPISAETRRRISEINRIKMTGKELKPISDNIKRQIIKLYQTIGPKLIERQLGVSAYLITKLLKNEGIYRKCQKGIGKTSEKNCSVSRIGNKNPMYKGEA